MINSSQKIPAADDSNYGKIRASGKDAVSVLHNILTNDIEKLTPGQQCPAAFLTNTGKIQLYMEVFRFEDHLILVIENQTAARGITLLDKYIITEEVQLDDVTDSYSFFQTFDSKPENFLCLKSGGDVFIKKHALSILSSEECEVLRIEAGIPRYGIDMDENTILSETGLDDVAVSETKGCYPGQEVVARIKTYKGLTKKLFGFSLEGNRIPMAGDKIYAGGNETSIGWITSAGHSPKTQKIHALGYLLKGSFDKNEINVIAEDGKKIAGKTVALNF